MAKNSTNHVDWMSKKHTVKHGDVITLTVSEEDQINGTPGSPTKCAVVQTLLGTSPKVYNAKVVEGDINIWLHGDDGQDWRGRLILDNATRELASKYDQHIGSPPTKITLTFDKWHEVKHRTYTPAPPPVVEGNGDENGQGHNTPAETAASSDNVVPLETPTKESNDNGEGVETETSVKKVVPRPRARKKSRWDVSHYIVPAA